MEKEIKQILELHKIFSAKTDGEIKAVTDAFKQRFKKGESLDSLLPEVFAVAKETIKRVYKQEIKDVHLKAAIGLHMKKIVEVDNENDKQAPRLMAAYLNILSGEGASILVDDQKKCENMYSQDKQFFDFLGVCHGVVRTERDYYTDEHYIKGKTLIGQKYEAYGAAITYVTDCEAGFDFLRASRCMDPNDQEVIYHADSFTIINDATQTMIERAATPLIMDTMIKGEKKIIGWMTIMGVWKASMAYKTMAGLIIDCPNNRKSTFEALFELDVFSVAENKKEQTRDTEIEKRDTALAWWINYDDILNVKQALVFLERNEIFDGKAREKTLSLLNDADKRLYLGKVKSLTKQGFDFPELEKSIWLTTIDQEWIKYINDMVKKKNDCKSASAVFDQFTEQANKQFDAMLEDIDKHVADSLLKIKIEKK